MINRLGKGWWCRIHLRDDRISRTRRRGVARLTAERIMPRAQACERLLGKPRRRLDAEAVGFHRTPQRQADDCIGDVKMMSCRRDVVDSRENEDCAQSKTREKHN